MKKSRYSKYYVLKKVDDDNWILETKTDDLEDKELQQHYNKAIRDEDYDYADAIRAEADSRSFKLKIRC